METHFANDRNLPNEAGDQSGEVTEAEHTAQTVSSRQAVDQQQLGAFAEQTQSEAEAAAPCVEAVGQLAPPAIPVHSDYLKTATLAELAGELLERIRQDVFSNNQEALSRACQIFEALRTSLDVHFNQFSRKRYRDLFEAYYTWVGPPRPQIEGATIVDLGCGTVNPFGLLFLFIMLGARRGIGVDLGEIQNWSGAASAMAEFAGLMVIDPGSIVGDYPITGKQVLENIAAFNLTWMRLGDPSGFDRNRLKYLQEPPSALSIGSSEADFLVSSGFLEHLTDVEGAIAEMARITRPGGYGIHIIDGSDHRRYNGVECQPLAFLEEDTDKPLVYGSNRIRPLEFGNIFRRHGFDVIDVKPFERIEVGGGLRERMVEPFRSLEDETLALLQCKFILRRAQTQMSEATDRLSDLENLHDGQIVSKDIPAVAAPSSDSLECQRRFMKERHKLPAEGGIERIMQALKEHYYCDPTGTGASLASPEGQRDLLDHLRGRLEYDREIVVPWLNEIRVLQGASILEIGCGTGSSTVAMAEQGAYVVGIDIREGALEVARTRCAVYGVTNCQILQVNATEVQCLLEERSFDLVIFFASLEHMSVDERLLALQRTWEGIPSGSYLVVIETPNRLWYFDHHTAWTNFYNWLPDELAFRYARRTARQGLHQLNDAKDARQEFLRLGRAVSFHEFELAFNCPVSEIQVSSCLSDYTRERTGYQEEPGSIDKRYEELLAEIYPQAHRGFFLPQLNLAFRKT